MFIRLSYLVAFTGLHGFFIGVWSITLLIYHLFVAFLFLEGTWSGTFYYLFIWIISHFSLWTTWGTGASNAPGAFLVVPILVTSPHLFAPLAWGAPFVGGIFPVPSRVPIHHPLPLRGFQPSFLCGAPDCCIFGAPCSLRLLFYCRFSGTLALFPIVIPDT